MLLKKEKEQNIVVSPEDEKLDEPDVIRSVVPKVLQQDSKVKESEYNELLLTFSDLNILYKDKKDSKWNEKCWYNYVYKSREINPLILPEVNAYLTELQEDEICDIMHVFEEYRKSQQMCEDIKQAVLEWPEISHKTMRSWMQSIKNLQFMMRKKMDTSTFKILRVRI
ncbi:protein CASC1 [Trichonephila clavata]|uniref:Protein CASC1 n=1 Tax=Trichonephila clavata TaxID=2740835 RepID=A0A8X6F1I1_TRICU|nr:protein CASC1 [Trichonephila clavata]